MPIYEYACPVCGTRFEALRPMSQADAPMPCPKCGSTEARRGLSVFAAVSKGAGGETRTVSGTGSSCATCGSQSCATCGH